MSGDGSGTDSANVGGQDPSKAAAQLFADMFEHQHWRVLAEASGVRDLGGVQVSYEGGFFSISGGQFLTPLGTPAGSEGVLVIALDEEGRDLPVYPQAFRLDVLQHAVNLYGTVAGLP